MRAPLGLVGNQDAFAPNDPSNHPATGYQAQWGATIYVSRMPRFQEPTTDNGRRWCIVWE
jgi:hypothetical protein